MTRHHLGLQGAAVLRTRHLLLTEQAVGDLVASEAMGAIVGPAGLGKTFAIAYATRAQTEPVVSLTFEGRPTMRLIADRLLHAFTGMPARGTRFAMTDELLQRLAERRRLIVIGEAQNLNRDCFEYLRHLHTLETDGSNCVCQARGPGRAGVSRARARRAASRCCPPTP